MSLVLSFTSSTHVDWHSKSFFIQLRWRWDEDGGGECKKKMKNFREESKHAFVRGKNYPSMTYHFWKIILSKAFHVTHRLVFILLTGGHMQKHSKDISPLDSLGREIE
jgi:hypothetical protein